MKTLLRLLLKTQHQQNRSGQTQTEKGMTLVELLIGAVMAFLIITPMLAFVVDMLNTDRREQVKSNTEQDIQAAVDFIAEDLSQAIYIYDNNNNTGIPAIKTFLPQGLDKTPILVFWKRQLMTNSLPINSTAGKPNTCNSNPGKCNDTYVLSLVAYYQFKDNDAIWCQPSGGPCPSRIARYEIRDGLKDPSTSDYYPGAETTTAQQKNQAFNPKFNLSKPTAEVTLGAALVTQEQVLVNYIDHTQLAKGPPIDRLECENALGNPTATLPGTTTTAKIDETTLKVSDQNTNSFYACVDTAKNIARVTIRGNSLRRLQPNNADYNAKNPAFFPTASVQVQGRGALGK
jgi:type II secretory pathway pseudopilin PulG